MDRVSPFPEKLAAAVRSELLRSPFPPAREFCVFGFDRVSSTMDIAGAIAAGSLPVDSLKSFRLSGESEDLAIVALSQTQGRGRKQRQWLSPEGRGIYVTFLFFSSAGPAQLVGLSLAMGLAVQTVVQDFGGKAFLKWPNDVLAIPSESREKRKLSGILVDVGLSQLHQQLTVPKRAIQIGIGLNLARQEFPSDLNAVSLEEVVGHSLPYEEVFSALCAQVLVTAKRFFEHGFASFASEWNVASGQVGERIRLEAAQGEVHEGIVLGVAEDGGLRLKDDSKNEILTIYSGEVSQR